MPYVEVYVDARDALDSLLDEELESELERRRRKAPAAPEPKPTIAIDIDDLASVRDRLLRGQVDEALILLERILPSEFSHLADDVRRFYEARPS